MSHVAPSIFNLLLFSFLLSVSGCSLVDKAPDAKNSLKPIVTQRIYFAPFDRVWRAAHAVLKYPIANENPDSGHIETEFIKGLDGFLPPEKNKPPSAGMRYKLVLNFAKGRTEGRESTRLTIEKKIEVLRDFFSDPETVGTDGLEEKVLFYRIERELVIFEALKKAPQ